MAVAAVECAHGGWGSPVTICMSATPARAWFVSLGRALVAVRPRASVSRFARLMGVASRPWGPESKWSPALCISLIQLTLGAVFLQLSQSSPPKVPGSTPHFFPLVLCWDILGGDFHSRPSKSQPASKAGQTVAPRQMHRPVGSRRSRRSNGARCVPRKVLVTHCSCPIVLLRKVYKQGN